MTAATMKQAFDNAETISVWPVPDLTLINNGRRAPVDMPSDLFGPAWRSILDVAEVTSTAPDYAAMGYLASAASLIGGKRWISPYGSGWSEPCILWCAALGDPSSRKSAPLDKMTRPLWAIQNAAKESHEEARREWQAECERAKAERAKWQEEVRGSAGTENQTPELPVLAVEPEEPQERRPVISDTTPEAAASVLKGNPQGVLCYNDELAGWLESFERYTTGGRPFWIAAHGGKPHNITRKGSGSLDLQFTGISVLGSIQPDKLVELLTGANDGLVPRILWAWPEKRLPERPRIVPDLSSLERAYQRLELLSWGQDTDGKRSPVILQLDDDAAETFESWDKHNASGEGDGVSLYDSFVGKLSGAVLRLALVAELTKWAFGGGEEPRSISRSSLAAAIEWCEDYAKPMAERVYGDAAVSVADRNAALVARYIRKNGLRRINQRELRQHPHRQKLKALQPKGAIDDAIEVLEASGWIRADFDRDGDTPGRQRKDYTVNPAVHEATQ
ncbi:DUF3987 domain-containing protein [Altererythrobacter sp. GH1-8]|uniref:DUF3987 domain-containing protein n=1 Tax=Altererythrobacter sp. GH1-8 TaxID=3349333 RepID=UPI00374DF059